MSTNFDAPITQTVSPSLYEDFWCDAQGRCDFKLPVFSVNHKDGKLMTIAAEECAIYITKEQAMAFYGLVEAGKTSVPR
jgi:hypothetical protein